MLYEIHLADGGSGYRRVERVMGQNWLHALRQGLASAGLPAPTRNLSCDLQEDDSVVVTDHGSGQVYRVSPVERRGASNHSAARPPPAPVATPAETPDQESRRPLPTWRPLPPLAPTTPVLPLASQIEILPDATEDRFSTQTTGAHALSEAVAETLRRADAALQEAAELADPFSAGPRLPSRDDGPLPDPFGSPAYGTSPTGEEPGDEATYEWPPTDHDAPSDPFGNAPASGAHFATPADPYARSVLPSPPVDPSGVPEAKWPSATSLDDRHETLERHVNAVYGPLADPPSSPPSRDDLATVVYRRGPGQPPEVGAERHAFDEPIRLKPEDASAPAAPYTPYPRGMPEIHTPSPPPPVPDDRGWLDGLDYELAELQHLGNDVRDACNFALDVTRHHVPCSAGAVLLIDARDRRLYFAAARGPQAAIVSSSRIPLDAGIAGAAIRKRTPLRVVNPDREPRLRSSFADSLGYRPNSLLCAPIFAGKRAFGVVELLDRQYANGFGDADAAVLSRVTARLGEHFQHLLSGPA